MSKCMRFWFINSIENKFCKNVFVLFINLKSNCFELKSKVIINTKNGSSLWKYLNKNQRYRPFGAFYSQFITRLLFDCLINKLIINWNNEWFGKHFPTVITSLFITSLFFATITRIIFWSVICSDLKT
jgi:hypothetical protein